MQNVDIHIAQTPALHFQLGGLVEIDRARADQGSAIIVDNVFLSRADDPESRAERELRPIGRRAHDMMAR